MRLRPGDRLLLPPLEELAALATAGGRPTVTAPEGRVLDAAR